MNFKEADSPERRVKLCVIIRQIFNRREPLDPGTLDKLASIARGESIFAPCLRLFCLQLSWILARRCGKGVTSNQG